MIATQISTPSKPVEGKYPSGPHTGKALTPKSVIEPEHLLQAIQNALEHSDETAHGVTGLTFKRYTITVRLKKWLCWQIECRFKAGGETDTRSQATSPS
jgi:hypothetical protein